MFRNFLYSLPVQLLLNHIKRNKVLLFFWLVLLLVTTGRWGNFLGLHYLILDPEYLGQSGFWSFLIIGVALGGFTMAFHITTYIIDIQRFAFVGALPRPFNKFCLNNSTIPLAYLVTYIISVVRFQHIDQQQNLIVVTVKVLGLLTGFTLVLSLMFAYAFLTNKDIDEYLSKRSMDQLKRAFFYRVKRLRQYLLAEQPSLKVYNYLETPWRLGITKSLDRRYDAAIVLRIFKRTQRRLLFFELVAVGMLFALGLGGQHAFSQIPAAASGILFLTILVLFTGLLAFWVRGWLTTVVLFLAVVLNGLTRHEIIFKTKASHALGLNYNIEQANYSLEQTRALNSRANYLEDKKHTLQILNNWRAKFPADKPPKLIIVCASGGGQRAALWTMKVLQTAERMTAGRMMEHTMLMSCVSGGALGASYFRELYLRKKLGESIRLQDDLYLDNISQNSLNPVVFNLVTNDMLLDINQVQYQGMTYRRDRGYALEEQINQHTHSILEKPLKAYRVPEFNSTIPMLLLAPTVVKDGSKLFISPHRVSYMGTNLVEGVSTEETTKIKGVDFMRCFQAQGAENLRFLSALRMCATYPYVLPSVTLPTRPAMQVMDAALFDNFGVADAVHFLHVFKDWILQHTSGIGLVIIRNSGKEREISQRESRSLLQTFTKPIGNLHIAWANMQDIRNDDLVASANTWLAGKLVGIEFQCIPEMQRKGKSSKRNQASLSWHLTAEDKYSVLQAMDTSSNQRSLAKLKSFLE